MFGKKKNPAGGPSRERARVGADVAARLMPRDGRLATPGGRDVFELFLKLGYAAFHLARAEGATLPGGREVFAGEETADVRLRRAGLIPGPTRWLDEPARVSLTVYKAG